MTVELSLANFTGSVRAVPAIAATYRREAAGHAAAAEHRGAVHQHRSGGRGLAVGPCSCGIHGIPESAWRHSRGLLVRRSLLSIALGAGTEGSATADSFQLRRNRNSQFMVRSHFARSRSSTSGGTSPARRPRAGIAGTLERHRPDSVSSVDVALVLEPGDEADHPLATALTDRGIPTHLLVLARRAYLAERRSTASLLRRISPDVLHTHGFRPDVIDADLARRIGIASVTTAHGFASVTWRGSSLRSASSALRSLDRRSRGSILPHRRPLRFGWSGRLEGASHPKRDRRSRYPPA